MIELKSTRACLREGSVYEPPRGQAVTFHRKEGQRRRKQTARQWLGGGATYAAWLTLERETAHQVLLQFAELDSAPSHDQSTIAQPDPGIQKIPGKPALL